MTPGCTGWDESHERRWPRPGSEGTSVITERLNEIIPRYLPAARRAQPRARSFPRGPGEGLPASVLRKTPPLKGLGMLDVGHHVFSWSRWQGDGEDRGRDHHQRFRKKDLRLWKKTDFCLCFCFFLMMGTHTSPHTSIMSPRDRKAGPVILRTWRLLSPRFRV